MNILIVEDDKQIQYFETYLLEDVGHYIYTASNIKEARNIINSTKLDMIILDLGLSDGDGSKLLEMTTGIPTLVVSARHDESEKVRLLDLGADDYITKPFMANEFLARVRVIERRIEQQKLTNLQKDETDISIVGNIKINFTKRLVYIDDKQIHLTALEYKLIELFFRNIDIILTTNFIIREIYGYTCPNDTQALRTLIAGLRRKIEKVPAYPQYLITEIGMGYRFCDPDNE